MQEATFTPLRVFIADDSMPIAEMLTALLARPGSIDVVGVGRSEGEALDRIDALRPDVVLVDLQLGEGSGANVIRAVRSRADLADLRLFVTSGYECAALKEGLMKLGADGVYDKVKGLVALKEALGRLASAKQATH